MNVLIFGSCVSRDVFNYDFNTEFCVVDYFARCSFASLNFPVPKKFDTNLILSNFQRKVVERDLESTFFNDIKDVDFDIFLIDFIDERFDLYEYDGGVCTLSSEFLSCKPDLTEGKVIKSGTSEWLTLWKKGFQSFFSEFRRIFPDKKMYLNKVFWAGYDENDKALVDFNVESENKKLKVLYSFAKKFINNDKELEYRSDYFVANSLHCWGEAPFHYVDELYESTLSMLRKNEFYSTSQWPGNHKNYTSLDDFVYSPSHSDGVSSISFLGGVLDVYCKNVKKASENKFLLIGFSGAITDRKTKRAPFFSGLGISDKLDLPLISIADPLLSSSSSLDLAWYAGSDTWLNLVSDIATLICQISELYNVVPILFGGSGGGFAALNVAGKLNCEAKVFVWNPQTSISDYIPEYVDRYINVAFPGQTSGGISDYDRLHLSGCSHDIKLNTINDNIEVNYVQNIGDWHYSSHAKPYIDSVGLNVNRLSKNNLNFFLADYEGGHSPLNSNTIVSILSRLSGAGCQVENLPAISKLVEIAPGGSDNIAQSRLEFDTCVEFTERGFIVGSFPVSNGGYHYAFYLLNNGLKVLEVPYSSKNYFHFDIALSDYSGVVEVVVFLRNADERASKRVEITRPSISG